MSSSSERDPLSSESESEAPSYSDDDAMDDGSPASSDSPSSSGDDSVDGDQNYFVAKETLNLGINWLT